MKVTIKPRSSKGAAEVLRELWQYKELIAVLVRRSISVRFAQTSLGVVWVVLQPILLTITFSVVFGFLARIDSPEVPYPVLVFSGVLLWQFFTRCVTEGSTGLQSYAPMIAKVYFPRLIVLLVPVLSAAVDVFVGLVVLIVMLLAYGIAPSLWALLIMPIVISAIGVVGFSLALVIAPLGIRRRDVAIALPFALQVGMYLTPVIYPLSFIPSSLHWLLYLNPMATLIETARWTLYGGPQPNMLAWAIVILFSCALLGIGYSLFQRAEECLVDEL